MRSYRGRGRAAFLAAGLWLGVLTIAQALADCLRRKSIRRTGRSEPVALDHAARGEVPVLGSYQLTANS